MGVALNLNFFDCYVVGQIALLFVLVFCFALLFVFHSLKLFVQTHYNFIKDLLSSLKLERIFLCIVKLAIGQSYLFLKCVSFIGCTTSLVGY